MTEQPYDSEAVLQELLAKYPNLLAGDQMDGAEPRRWLLVSREMGVPGEEDGASAGRSTTCSSTRTRSRRWSRSSGAATPASAARSSARCSTTPPTPSSTGRSRRSGPGSRDRCERTGSTPTAVLATSSAPGGDAEAFWQQVKTNLQAGRVRLVFVADVIPPELRRVVEFLNGQMDPAEVLAVEVRQFVGRGAHDAGAPRHGPDGRGGTQEGRPDRRESGSGTRRVLRGLWAARGDRRRRWPEPMLRMGEENGPASGGARASKDGSFFPMPDRKGGTTRCLSRSGPTGRSRSSSSG